jgi:REP element-mobilizing transposase RayT
MSRKYKFHNPESLYFISFATVYWIDVFIRNEYKWVMLDSWEYCKKEKGLDIYAWIIMTNHIHMIVGSKTNKLENIIRDMKSFTSRKLRECISKNMKESRREWMLKMMKQAGTTNSNNRGFQLWQQNNNPIELYDNRIMEQKLDYLHNNPVVGGIVDEPEDYVFSSARDYAGKKGLIEIELIQ